VIVDKVLRCDCGFEARAASDDELAVEVRRHARDEHGMRLSRAQARELVARAAITRRTATRGKEKQ
jgi:predicted small metal-binding protein